MGQTTRSDRIAIVRLLTCNRIAYLKELGAIAVAEASRPGLPHLSRVFVEMVQHHRILLRGSTVMVSVLVCGRAPPAFLLYVRPRRKLKSRRLRIAHVRVRRRLLLWFDDCRRPLWMMGRRCGRSRNRSHVGTRHRRRKRRFSGSGGGVWVLCLEPAPLPTRLTPHA